MSDSNKNGQSALAVLDRWDLAHARGLLADWNRGSRTIGEKTCGCREEIGGQGVVGFILRRTV